MEFNLRRKWETKGISQPRMMPIGVSNRFESKKLKYFILISNSNINILNPSQVGVIFMNEQVV